MSDYTLMNPVHLQKEIDDLENHLLPEGKKLADDIREQCDEIYAMFRRTREEDGQPITLTIDQQRQIIRTLSQLEIKSYNYYTWHEHALRVYRLLQKDKRWLIGSKLRFLNK